MRPRLLLFTVLTVLTPAVEARQAPVPVPKPTAAILPGAASIAGRVSARANERPLPGVLLTLASGDRGRALVTYSDAAGRYEFTHIAAGEYRVIASHPDYVTTEFGLKEGRMAVGSANLVRLDRDTAKTGVDFSLVRGGAITGTITREGGHPLSDVLVVALQVEDGGGGSMPPNSATRTDARGEYALPNLPEGRYRLDAMWSEEGSGSKWGRNVRTLFYPGTTRAQEIVAVPVSPGAAARNIDIVFPASDLLRISGRIVHGSGAGQAEAFVMSEGAAKPVSVAPDGTFTTPYLRAGRHTLLARAWNDDALEATLMTLDLHFDLTDVVLGLMPTGTISGRVITDDGTAVSNEMQVAAVLADDGKELDEYRRDRADIGPDGEFVVRGVFGQRVMRMVGVTAGWKIARVTVGKSEITALSVEPGVDIDDVLIVLTRS